jgi:hypothetical protein
VGFEISAARGAGGAGLISKPTRPGNDGVSVRVIGNQLGLASASWMTNTGTRTGNFSLSFGVAGIGQLHAKQMRYFGYCLWILRLFFERIRDDL